MSEDGRARRASVPDASASIRDGGCAADTFPPRTVGTAIKKPITPEDREALRRLCKLGKMIRRSDGSYGTPKQELIACDVAARLKARRFAIPGFDRELVPTAKGIQANGEGNDATG